MSRWFLGAAGALVGLAVAFAGVVLLLWLLGKLWEKGEEEEKAPGIEIEVAEPEPPAEPTSGVAVEAKSEEAEDAGEAAIAVEAAEIAEAPTPAPDDLTRIEGIGPKIASVLQAAGISTYAQLAKTDPEQLAQILHDADPRLSRLAHPDTWPEQAALAADEEWEALQALKDTFKRGRRA